MGNFYNCNIVLNQMASVVLKLCKKKAIEELYIIQILILNEMICCFIIFMFKA